MARFPPPEKDIEAALRHARLVEAAPDFAGLTDVAQVPGLPRQNLHKLMNKNRHSVPAPAHAGRATIWHLADVLSWLHAKGACRLERSLIDVAQAARHINDPGSGASAPAARRQRRHACLTGGKLRILTDFT